MELVAIRERFDRRDRLARDGAETRDAGAERLTIDEHGARAALPFAAAELAAGETDFVSEDERRLSSGAPSTWWALPLIRRSYCGMDLILSRCKEEGRGQKANLR